MQPPPLLPLVLLSPSEESVTWDDFSTDPMLLFAEFAKRYAVQGNTINDNIIKSSKLPTAKDRGKLWIKESWPYAIVSLIDGEYHADYGISGYMPNTPFLHRRFSPGIDYIRELSSSELIEYGLTDTIDKETATKRMYWHIFEPPAITI